MGSIVGVFLFLFLLFIGASIALALVLGVAGVLFLGSVGLLYRGVSSRPTTARIPPAEVHVAAGPPTPPGRRVLLIVGGLVALGLSLICLSPLAFLGVKYGPEIASRLWATAMEARERPTLDAALEDVRQFALAERAYRAKSGGFFGTPGCLARPQGCIPGYAGPPFIDAAVGALGTRGGFVWTFHPLPAADPATGVSPSSLSGYALLGVRAEPSGTSMSICGDAHGPDEPVHVCTFPGRELDSAGVCPDSCLWHSWSIEPLDTPRAR